MEYLSKFCNTDKDYTKVDLESKMITKEGIICFNGNSDIKESMTELSAVAQTYKHTMKINKIKI